MRRPTLLLTALFAVSATATAQWADNFDSYASGTLLDNVGGWYGWDNTPAGAGTATNAQAHSAPNSIIIANVADAVHPNLGATSGRWVMTLWQYMPTSGLTADTYVILNNVYNHGGPHQWTGQFRCDPTTNTVVDDLRAANTTAQPIQFDTWIEWRIEIDLDRNTIACYYDNRRVSYGVYNDTVSATDPIAIENLDLFTTGGTCYYDDISLLPATDSFGADFQQSTATTDLTLWISEAGAANGVAAIIYSIGNAPWQLPGVVSGTIYLNPAVLVELPTTALDVNGSAAVQLNGYQTIGLPFYGWMQAFCLPAGASTLLATDAIALTDGDDGVQLGATIVYNNTTDAFQVSYEGPAGTTADIIFEDAGGTQTTLATIEPGAYANTQVLGNGEKLIVNDTSTGTELARATKN